MQAERLAADGIEVRKLDEVFIGEVRAVAALRLDDLRADLLLNVRVLCKQVEDA